MGCRCAERRAAIISATRQPKTALTAVKFVAKSGAQDAFVSTKKMLDNLQRRGSRTG